MSILAGKTPKYLRQLAIVYEKAWETYKRDVITQGKWFVRQNTHWDGYDGGMDGHTVVLFAPLETVASIKPSKQSEIARQIHSDLAELNSVSNEYFGNVVIEAEDENDPECQAATAFSERPPLDPESVSIWKPGLARMFLSHRDKHKAAVREVADALENYGLSCFVAHETIPDDEDWKEVILQGLETMEIMVAVTTEDFSESYFCMQEIGYALGKGVPVISLKVSKSDPCGFISHKQGARSSLDTPILAAEKLFPLIGKRLAQTDRFAEVLVQSFCDSTDFTEAKNRFERMKANVPQLTDDQAGKIAAAFESNDQLHNAGHLTSRYQRLVKFMNAATDGSWTIESRQLLDQSKVVNDDLDDDIPF